MKTTIEMAREAGLYTKCEVHSAVPFDQLLERFAAFVRADEREAFANDWETLHGYDKHGVAEAIRARGNT